MAPTPIRRITAVQNARLEEITHMNARLRAKAPDSLNKNIIDSRIDALNTIWTEARESHAEIVARDDAEADPYVVNNIFTNIQTAYEDLLDELLTRLAQFDSNADPPVPPIPGNIELLTDKLDAVKMPKLDLPKFSGNYEDWESFADLFNSLVHSKKATDATKLSYLKLCLTGTAADLVKDVATTDANYITTWQALKQRFYNPRLIVNNHLNALMNIAALKTESATDLRVFADEAQRVVRALTNLKMPVKHWDIWFVHILSARLDPESRKLWESALSEKDRSFGVTDENAAHELTEALHHFPKFSDFATFLEKRSQTLNMISTEIANGKKSSSFQRQNHGARKSFHTQQGAKSSPKCELCSGSHHLWKCYKLKAKSSYERRSEIRRLGLCFNCFGQHKFNACNSKGRCGTCKEKHHTLLHFDNKRTINTSQESESNDKKFESKNETATLKNLTNSVNVHTANASPLKNTVILATAQVIIHGPHGKHTRIRALLDQGSEATLVTESIAQLLGLPKRPANISLSGLGTSSSGTAKAVATLTLQSSINPEFKVKTEALILPRLTSYLPAKNVIEIDLRLFANLPLADPKFYIKDTIDMIIGADLYGSLLKSGLKGFSNSNLIAQNTVLGWILSGSVQTNASRRADRTSQAPLRTLLCISNNDLDDSLQKFWKLEEFTVTASKYKPEDEACEHLFCETHARDSSGRYVVRIPLKSNPPSAANETRRMSLGSLSHLHHRFSRNSKLAEAYREFMKTYEQLGHMTRIPLKEVDNQRAWYLPHHAVVRYIQSSMKLRVVFDASRQTRDKYCLNNFLMAGPALQSDLDLILLNWRIYRYVFTADIVKMFRQIGVVPEDQDYQRILWAPSANETPVEYRLTTVTYGTACAPYLAIRTLMQLAQDEKDNFPLGAECLERNTYVDDIFVGADSLSNVISKRIQLTAMLKTAGIELDKWASNHEEILPMHVKQTPNELGKQIDNDATVKTLGILWNPSRDMFTFNTLDFKELASAPTKRAVLSNIARLFDPLGWLSPVTVTAKILMQDLWLLKCDWDFPLPIAVRDRWVEYCNSLDSLSNLSIERWIGAATGKIYQLHGFCDASTRAYACAVYIRVHEGEGTGRVHLLASKTKVAPVKTVSIPNLELCGAVLLVKLLSHLRKLEFFKGMPVFAWSDSQVVLNWLRKHPSSWKTFVANRVSYIQTEMPSAVWAHVPTKENPADLASRGCKSSDLIKSDAWWHGPTWLSQPSEMWPTPAINVKSLHSRKTPAEPEMLTKYSSFTRLIRVAAYLLRPLINLRRRRIGLENFKDFLRTDELNYARLVVIKLAQVAAFGAEISQLKAEVALPKRSCLRKLNPYLDENNVLRVGGRLAHSKLSVDPKNPPILPQFSTLSLLIVQHAHKLCLHGGPTLTTSYVMRQVWIIKKKRLINLVIRNCVTCQHVKPKMAHQLMGDLPADRVTPARPFSTAGLDYAGPIQVRTTKGRGYKSYKGYIVLFVCFVTRAIHLELVSDCTSAMFISAYRRFVCRRGICNKLFSDNSTTFQGADKELKAMFKAASVFYTETAALLANDGTSWNFIPPSAPHYGGLWEAGVKSVKHHLKRVIGDHTLTFEELSTVLTEIEACLNSRPLYPMSSEADNLHALTPAHFLIGETPGMIPDEEPPGVPEERLSRFQLMQRLRNNFWKRWSTEYLQHLQERGKWRDSTDNFAIGQLVLIMDDRYPPTKWPLGRIIATHPGVDKLVRVVTVKTSTSTLKRHIARLAPLSMLDNSRKIEDK